MCLLSISTGKFLMVALAALCLYELGVFLYFKFVKNDSSQLSKNEARKSRERVQETSAQRTTPSLKTSAKAKKKESQAQNGAAAWEDLIDYRKAGHGASQSLPSREEVRQEAVVDAFSPEDTHVDFSRMDTMSRNAVEDLLGNASSLVVEAEPMVAAVVPPKVEPAVVEEPKVEDTKMDATPVQSSPKEEKQASDSDVSDAFPELDFSNMLG